MIVVILVCCFRQLVEQHIGSRMKMFQIFLQDSQQVR
jgi:hypothetical protein